MPQTQNAFRTEAASNCFPAVRLNSRRGFSLVEMMIALVILSVAILGMTSVTLMTIRTNIENDLRNAVVRVTSEVAENLVSMPIDDVVATPRRYRIVACSAIVDAVTGSRFGRDGE